MPPVCLEQATPSTLCLTPYICTNLIGLLLFFFNFRLLPSLPGGGLPMTPLSVWRRDDVSILMAKVNFRFRWCLYVWQGVENSIFCDHSIVSNLHLLRLASHIGLWFNVPVKCYGHTETVSLTTCNDKLRLSD